ncbi:MAG: flagellar basal-body rod protein FlgF [Rhodobacteraceae bacterium]|nr:MAG: flagellar basal-body rod protein FlgF [Paracoccaceae bacterium]
MSNSTFVSLSLNSVLARELDMTANNIANANTAGFKGERLTFDTFLMGKGDNQTEFVVSKASFVDEKQGAVTYTGNTLDVALQGEGWFSYRTLEGQVVYGRDGRFSVDTQGNLVTLNGDHVLDDGGGDITFPPDTANIATISKDGTISAEGNGTIAKIGVFTLPDLQSFERIGAGRFTPPGNGEAEAIIDPSTKVLQGAIEGSNVQPVLEMTRLISMQRAYERSNKLMDGEDDLRRKTLQKIGQPV